MTKELNALIVIILDQNRTDSILTTELKYSLIWY